MGLPTTLPILHGLFLITEQNVAVCQPICALKLPPRILFTDEKRSDFARELSRPASRLNHFARTLPTFGSAPYRDALDISLRYYIPMSRVLWLVRCTALHDLRDSVRRHARAGKQGTGFCGTRNILRETVFNFAYGGQQMLSRDQTHYLYCLLSLRGRMLMLECEHAG